jgi:hypothetical protein
LVARTGEPDEEDDEIHKSDVTETFSDLRVIFVWIPITHHEPDRRKIFTSEAVCHGSASGMARKYADNIWNAGTLRGNAGRIARNKGEKTDVRPIEAEMIPHDFHWL